MNTTFDCIPCFVRQALDAVKFATEDEKVRELVLRKVLTAISHMDLRQSPPLMGRQIHRIIRKLSGNHDPYKHVKKAFNKYALSLYPALKARIQETSDKRFETAVRLAVCGNIIDFGASTAIDQTVVKETIESSLSEPLLGDLKYFQEIIYSAQHIIYLADNAGEIVFDRLLLEELQINKVILVVRGYPVINDATYADAVETGITDFVSVVDNGSDAPGTVIEECSESFQQLFRTADVIIAKGQGNYETLSDNDKRICFLVKVKCPVIADHMNCEVGNSIIKVNE